MEQSSTSSPKRSKKACTECRQQKSKCNASLNPGQPCSRCLKVGSECIVSDPFKREHKRQRLTDLQHETDELRQKLKSSQHINHGTSPIAMLTAAAELSVNSGNNGVGLRLTSPPPIPPMSHYSQQMTPVSLGPSVPGIPDVSEEHSEEPTSSQTLNGIALTGKEIDELFQLFFDHYSRFLPIVDPKTNPDTYHVQSPFLFWSIVSVACQTYPRNPTLLSALSRSITELALLAIATTSAWWHTIRGLLINLTWPFPKENGKPDVTFPLCGMLLHIAMQNGLHIPMSSHEFSKVKVPAPSEADMIRRSELWAHCVIVYQRACAAKGQSAPALVNIEQEQRQNQVLVKNVSPSLVLKLKSQELVARCSAAVLENGVRNMSVDKEQALDILLRSFESQMGGLEAEAITDDDKLHATLCRLCMQVFHFFKNQSILTTKCLPRVLNTACVVIDSVKDLGDKLGALSTAPIQVNTGTLLASVALLRILKCFASSGLDSLDTERAKACFFTAINLEKQMSVESNDAAAKAVVILSQLWNSTKAFRKADGSEYTALRIRSRLVLSPVLDAVWWWRDEFDPLARTMAPSQGDTTEGVDVGRENPGASTHLSAGPLAAQEALHFDDHFLADFEWALGDDCSFPPTEPYNATWNSVETIP